MIWIKEDQHQRVVQNLTQTIICACGRPARALGRNNHQRQLEERTTHLGTGECAGETSASMEEMTSTVKQNADNAKQANQLAIAGNGDIADKGGSETVRAVEAMGEINKSSKKIATSSL